MIKKGFSLLGIGLLYLISFFPFWFIYIVSDFLYIILYYVLKYRRKVVYENLLNAFPEKPETERNKIEKQYFHFLADLILETIKSLTISEKEVIKRMYIPNPAMMTAGSFKRGHSVIGALGHYANWELAALRYSLLFQEKRIIVYKPLSNKTIDNLFINMRSRFGATLVTMKSTMRKLVELRNELTMTVLVSDQTPSREEAHYFTNFLNQPTAVFLGVEKLAISTNSEVVFCDIRRLKRGYYQCTFVPMFTDPKLTAEYEITNAHVQYLERMIRQEPAYWLWSHRRWKFKPEDVH